MKANQREAVSEILLTLADSCKEVALNKTALLLEAVAVAVEAGNEAALYQSFVQHFLAQEENLLPVFIAGGKLQSH